ncbi:hypothetical protein FQN57_005418 [Myotisia sp. PD_48]|nr:hypothetical protein FQN57_005418 [Myotisia sp. PD_48]
MMLGKRKRETTVVSREKPKPKSNHANSDRTSQQAQEALRKYFESRFQPLEGVISSPGNAIDSTKEDTADNTDESGWSGIDEDEEEEEDDDTDTEASPIIVDYSASASATSTIDDIIDKSLAKSFMSTKPPSSAEPAVQQGHRKKKAGDGDGDESVDATNLKNDLALQRLLKESHLLDSASDLNPTGANRHKALDLRAQAVGAKTSIFTQQKMPMSHRKGITAKANQKGETRRREARENGIILERPTSSLKRRDNKRRDRGIGTPSVGRFVGGTLKLSQRDVAHIQGPKKKSTRDKGKRR